MTLKTYAVGNAYEVRDGATVVGTVTRNHVAKRGNLPPTAPFLTLRGALEFAAGDVGGEPLLPFLIDVTAATPLPEYRRDKTGCTLETRQQRSVMDKRTASIAQFRRVAKEYPGKPEFAIALGKPFHKWTVPNLSDYLYAVAWCKASNKTMADYLAAGFHGAPGAV